MPKGVIRRRKVKRERQYNDLMKKEQKDKQWLQNTTYKTKIEQHEYSIYFRVVCERKELNRTWNRSEYSYHLQLNKLIGQRIFHNKFFKLGLPIHVM